MIKSIILIILLMFGIPILLGLGILKFDKKGNKNICLAEILGLFLELLVFELFAIPMTFLGCSFTLLKYSWLVIMIILSGISIFLNRKSFKEIFEKNLEGLKKLPKILTVVFLILLVLQCYFPCRYMHEDYDDSNFVAKAVIAIDTDTLFKYNDAGFEYEEFPTRTVLSQFPHYTATIAALADIHPTILAHTIFPVVFIVIAYGLYYVFGMTLFKKDQTKTMVFLILLSIIYIFGDYSRYTNFVRLLYRTWQGKSLLANITIPFIWYIFIEYIGKENNKLGWFILCLTLGGSIAFSSMAFILPPMMVAILIFLYAIKDKKKGYVIALGVLFILAIIGITFYLTLDNPIVKNETLQNEELTFMDKLNVFIDEVKSEDNLNLLKESFERAGGIKSYLVLFIIAIVFMLINIKKEDKDITYTFTIFSIVVMLININPLFSKLWGWIIGTDVYWRVYWILPIGYVLAYIFTKFIFVPKNKIIQIIITITCITIVVLTGKFIFTKENYKEVNNLYKIPDELLEVLLAISEDDEEYKKVGGPEEIIVYARQVDGNVLLPHERLVNGKYWKSLFVKIVEEGDFNKILKSAIRDKCNYIVFNLDYIKDKKNLEKYECKMICKKNKLYLYKIEIEE